MLMQNNDVKLEDTVNKIHFNRTNRDTRDNFYKISSLVRIETRDKILHFLSIGVIFS